MNDHQPSRAQQLLRAIRKEIPEALADEQDHDDAEVAAMLRELGIALVECEQPTQLVAARLLAIATSTRAKPSVWNVVESTRSGCGVTAVTWPIRCSASQSATA